MKKIMILLSAVLLSAVFTSCGRSGREYTAEGFALDTYIQIKLYKGGTQETADRCISMCSEYEKIFSRTDSESELYSLNKTGVTGINSEEKEELAAIIREALGYSAMTDGVFDITIEPVSSLWDFKLHTVPEEERIYEALERVGYDRISLTDEEIRLNDTGIDLGGAAKGYIADRIKEYLVSEGVTSALINLGGNILCIGSRPDGSDFSIGIREPFGNANDIIAGINISDMSVVTSGVYERYFEKNGILYHHVLNPETGFPSQSGLYSVTIISERSLTGDCLSTACLIMGLDGAEKLIDSLDGIYAVFVDEDNNVYYSAGAEKYVR